MDEYLTEKLKKYASSGVLPMHMPGHKRNAERFPWLDGLGAHMDITEIDGFDNLNDPRGIFRDMNSLASALWGAKYSFCLVNGSTAGILAAVKLALGFGGDMLMGRNSHMSLYNAAEIMGARVRHIVPPVAESLGIFASVTAESVERELENDAKIRLVAVTSPTYEGVISDIAAIAEVCHRHGALLLVDEAHGAHLGFGAFPRGAVQCGADIVVQSLHKTLPSPTQTAVLHICTDRVSYEDARRAVAMFQSSSPSYLLSSGIDGCLRYMQSCGDGECEVWLKNIENACAALSKMSILRLAEKEDGMYGLDPSKLVISTRHASISGAELMARLRREYNIELEMAAGDYVVAMTGMGDTADTLARFTDALLDIDARLEYKECAEKSTDFALPPAELTASDALRAEKTPRALEEAEGEVSAEYVWVYPPGIPLVVPGERVTRGVIEAIEADERSGLSVRSTANLLPHHIMCVGGIASR